ncbi:hypothetical protein D1AOALGA4SA_620 [Olavius algarvensis Delta 1 endosymbiont]|nr:hypothetical protein D1AOALGA4SA_620 [Olavius algarvensis Delta 1 endosymbiont]
MWKWEVGMRRLEKGKAHRARRRGWMKEGERLGRWEGDIKPG